MRPATKRSRPVAPPRRPTPPGLYDPENDHDACGVGFIVDLKQRKSRQIVEDGIRILENLEHRGATGSDPLFGDGAGIMVQIPHRFFAREAETLGFTLPQPGHYAVGVIFLPVDAELRARMEKTIEDAIAAEGQVLLGWRDVPTDNASLSKDSQVAATEPAHRQVFIGRGSGIGDEEAFERKLYIVRKVISSFIFAAHGGLQSAFYIVSMSCRTIVYKGMFLSYQLAAYYADLHDPLFESAFALVHQRFATNTFPSWRLAHPYRMVAHNGEINTKRGNVNWMAARQASVRSALLGDDIDKLWPISFEGQSDTACFDNALEFLIRGGYSLPHAAMMLIPEAWAGNPLMDEERRAFYEYHAALMEPWDGPAAMAFSDGKWIGATLDRNGLRPARYIVTADDMVIMASEAGTLPVEESRIVKKWRLQPGKMLLINLEQGRIISDDEIKSDLARRHPYKKWVARTQIVLEDLPPVPPRAPETAVSLLDRQQAFGYTAEDLKFLLTPMAETGEEAVGSMGNDAPISALSDKSKLLFTYFKQNFAQVTNPPIDSIREQLVMSLVSFIGPRPNLFDIEGEGQRKRLEARQPILTNEDLEKIRAIGEMDDNPFHSRTLDITYPASDGAGGMPAALDRLCAEAIAAVENGINIIILSDRMVGPGRVPIPSLLATAGVHHHLIREGLRTSVGIVVETGDAREVHHFSVLAGYGAEAINPYLAFETLFAMKRDLAKEVDDEELVHRYIKAIDKGLLKVMAKMGISTYQSYCGAQIFDAVGLSSDFVAHYFTGTATTIEGVGLDGVAEETLRRHDDAFGDSPVLETALDVGGDIAFMHAPKTIDNDLVENDHTPGFISAAWFVASAFMSVDLDFRALPGLYVGIVMGRNAGFLTAAAATWRRDESDGPHLVYVPERNFTTKQFVEDIARVRDRYGRCTVAMSEGVHDAEAKSVVESLLGDRVERDAHGNVRLSGGDLGVAVQAAINDAFPKVRSRVDTFGYLPRGFATMASDVDRREAFQAGAFAVAEVERGSGSVALTYDGGKTVFKRVPLEAVAAKTRLMPASFLDAPGTSVTPEGMAYLKRLIPKAPETYPPFLK